MATLPTVYEINDALSSTRALAGAVALSLGVYYAGAAGIELNKAWHANSSPECRTYYERGLPGLARLIAEASLAFTMPAQMAGFPLRDRHGRSFAESTYSALKTNQAMIDACDASLER